MMNSISKLVCGDCRARLEALELGEFDRSIEQIGYGRLCEVHPGALEVAATNPVLVRPGWEETWREATLNDLPVVPRYQGEPGAAAGPLTTIAATLLASWTRENPDTAAQWAGPAVEAAHLLLSLTKGA